MKNTYKRYIVGIFMILSQYMVFTQFGKVLGLHDDFQMVVSFAFIFLYLKENIYSFDTCLIWEELKKQIKCTCEYLVLVGILILVFKGPKELWKYELLGIIGFCYSFVISKLIRFFLYDFLKENVIIVGVGDTAKELKRIIDNNRFTMYSFLGFVNINQDEKIEINQDEIVADENNILDFIKKNKVEEVIVALPELTPIELSKVVDKFEKIVKKIKTIPKIHKMYTFAPIVQDYDGVMLVSTKNNIMSLKRRILKRSFDILGGSIGLLLLLPLYLKYGREIKKDGGKILFSHNRIGIDLKPFKMHKFRSMYIDAEDRLEKLLVEDENIKKEFYTNFKLKNDPRITSVGDFLRRTSLDEFPQFLNVIKGEMSLVGPRPVVQKEVDMYYGSEMGQKIFQVKPGITGMWQANGRSDVEDYEERIALDLYYIRNWSLWLDIIILIKTVKNVIQKRGAY